MLQDRSAAWLDSLPADQDPEATLRPGQAAALKGNLQTGYVIQRELGRGGMGAVHAADQSVFSRTVALKSLLVDTPVTRRTFWAEAVATARLEHPNIVPVHDLQIGHNGVPQLIMKLVEGSTWKTLLHPKTDAERARVADWELDRHLEILLKVCDAVAFAHTRSILHLDLKPENVMVGGFGEVLVMDWGCAVGFGTKRPHPLLSLASELTMIAGTPAYMPPELAQGDGEALGPWSDVYLLGAILYEILCGSPPHRSPGGVKAVLAKACAGEIEHPEHREPGKSMPDELVSLALDALAKDPAKRLREVGAFSARIRDYLHHSQAATLLDRAREHLKAGTASSGSKSDDDLRRAIGACEQALEMWPNYRAARRLLVRASLAAATRAMTSGSFALARTQAETARRLAKDLNQSRDVEEAGELIRRATIAERERANRARQILWLKRLFAGAAAVALVVLAIGLTVITRQQHQTRAALAEAERARAGLEAEKAERQRQAREAAPRFIAEAEGHMRTFAWPEARKSIEIATVLDPDQPIAWRLLGEILLGEANLAQARSALERAGTDGQALISTIATFEPRLAAAKSQDRQRELYALSDAVRQAGAPLAAGYLRRDTKEGLRAILDDVRTRLIAANPKVTTLNWIASIADDQANIDVSRNPGLTDISPLAGLPIATLNCSETGVTSIGVLRAMPLASLTLARTRIDDLTPLAGLPLKRLVIRDSAVTNLAPLAGMPLTELDCEGLKVKDWSPLRALPLQYLRVGNSSFNDFSLLSRMPLRSLSIDGLRIDDLTPIAGLKLTTLSISGTRVANLTPLRTMPLTDLVIGSAPVTNLEALADSRLDRLSLVGNQTITDLSPLRRTPLTALDLRESKITDIEAVAGLTRLKSLGSMPGFRLLPASGNPTAAGLELRCEALIGRLSDVPALASTLNQLKLLKDLARWKQGAATGAPKEAKAFGTTAFLLIEVPLRWDDARRVSAVIGGRLACLDTDAALDFAKATWPGKGYLIGGNRTASGWTWLNGGPIKPGRWEMGAPPTGSDPRQLRISDKGLSDASPDQPMSFLVEWNR